MPTPPTTPPAPLHCSAPRLPSVDSVPTVRAPRRPLDERIAEAESRSARALGNYNEEIAKGNALAASRWLSMAQRWLDKANDLRGQGCVS